MKNNITNRSVKMLMALCLSIMACLSAYADVTVAFTSEHPRQSFVLSKQGGECVVSLKSQKDKTCAFTIYDHAGQEVSAKDGKKIHFISSGTKVFYTLQAGEHYTVDSHLDPGDQGFTIVIDDSEGTAATLDQMRAGAVELPASAGGRYMLEAPIAERDGSSLTDYAWYRISYSDVRPAMIYAEGVARLSMRLVAYNASTGELTEVGTRTTYNLDNLYTYAFDQSGAEYYLLLRSRDQIGWVDYPLVCKPQEELRPYWEACANEAPTVSESRGYLSFHTEPSDQIGLMGYRWYKFVPQYTGKYSISTVNTSGDLINGVNKPCALLLSADLDILGSAYQNDPTNLTEFLLQYDMEAGTTYYMLVKDYDNIAGSTRINITCQKWVDEQPKDTEDGLMSITFTPANPVQSFVLNHDYRLCTISVLTQKDDICSITVRDQHGDAVVASDGKTSHFIGKNTSVSYVFHAGELYTIDSNLGAEDRGFTIEMIGLEGTTATPSTMSSYAESNGVLGRSIYSAKSVPIVEGDGSKLTDYVWYKVDPSGLSSISFASGAGKYRMKAVTYGLFKDPQPEDLPVAILPTYSMQYKEMGTTEYFNLDPIVTYDFNFQTDFSGTLAPDTDPEYYILLRADDKIGKVDFNIVSQQDPSYYGPSSTLWYNSSKTAETVEEGTSEVSFRYENKAGQGFLGYTWYKLVSDFTDHYTIKTINTSSDVINGRNEPAMLLLDADGNILKQAHRNDPESPTECRIEHDMVEGNTYYILVKDYANIAEPTRMSITCPAWIQLLEELANNATTMSMGKIQMTLAPMNCGNPRRLQDYNWYKFVPPYTDDYTHYYPKDVAFDMIWLNENYQDVASMRLTAGKSYYLLMRKSDGTEHTLRSYLDCPKQLEYDKANVYPEQFGAETLNMGVNLLTIPAIEDTYGYRPEFNYHVAQIVPGYIGDYYFRNDASVEYKVYDGNMNLVTKYRFARRPYYVLYRRTDLSATPEGEQDMLYVNSINQMTSNGKTFDLGENTFTTEAVHPSLKDEIFGYNIVKYIPRISDDYYFYTSEGLEYKLFDSSLKPITYRNLTAYSSVYIGYRRKDFSATPEGKQDTLYICCRESFVADCESFVEGENVFTTSAITPMLTDMFGGYNVRKFVPDYTSDYFLYTSDGLEYKVLDSSLKTVEGSRLTKDATYYIAYRRKDLKDTPEGIQDKLYISCRENFIAGCESFSEGENVFTTFAINPLQKDEIYGYNVRRFVPEYTGDYYFNASESIEFKIVTPYLSEKEGSHPHLTRGGTYYILYRHKDLSATPEGKQDFLFIECNGFWLDTSHIEGALYEGENEVSLLPPLQEEHQQLFRGYHSRKFTPSESDVYFLETSDPSMEVRIFDGPQEIVFAGTRLFETRAYTILYRHEGDAPSDDNALVIINIVKRVDLIERAKRMSTDFSVGANTLELQPVENPRPYESMLNYHIGKFRPQFTCKYAFVCDDNIEYFVRDEELNPIDMAHGSTLMGYKYYYLFYKVKNGADASATSSQAYIVSEKAMLALGLNSIYSCGDEGQYPTVDLQLSYSPLDVRLEFAEDVDCKFISIIDDEEVESATWEECMAGYNPVIRVRRTDGQSGLMDIRVIPEIDIDGELHVGDNHVVADPISPNGYMSHWFSFTPERTDKYVFISDETEVSTFIIDAEELTEVKYAYDPDVWYFGRVIFEIELQAGHEYYIGMTAYDSKDGHANIIVAYEDNETVLQSYALSPAQPLGETELLALPQLPANVRAAVETYKENGMPYEAYLISTPEELAWLGDLLSSDPDKNVVAVLANDIVMNDVMTMPMARFATVKQATPYLWTPISRNGEGDTHIIGQGHTIRGLYYDSWHNSLDKRVRYAGLFGEVANMHLYDVGLEQFSITHGSELGAFAGKASFSTFDGCWVKSARCFIQYLSSDYSNLRNAVGGFVGIADAVDFTNCYSEINCYLKESINTLNNGGAFAGTLTGRNFRHSQVANNYACGTTFTDVFVSDVQQYIDCENNYYAASNYAAFSNNLNATQAEHPETGEYAYRLQGSQERHYWGQYIGRDPHPVLHSSLRVAYDADEDRYYNPVVGDYNGDGTVDMADVTTLRDIVIEKQGDKHHVGSLTNTKHYEKPHIADIPLLIDILSKE